MTDLSPAPAAPAAGPSSGEAIIADKGGFKRAPLSHDKMQILATKLNAEITWNHDAEKGAWVGTAPHGTYTITKDKSDPDPEKHALQLNFVSADGMRTSDVRLTDQTSEYSAKQAVAFKIVDNLNQTARDHPLLDAADPTPETPPEGEEDKL